MSSNKYFFSILAKFAVADRTDSLGLYNIYTQMLFTPLIVLLAIVLSEKARTQHTGKQANIPTKIYYSVPGETVAM